MSISPGLHFLLNLHLFIPFYSTIMKGAHLSWMNSRLANRQGSSALMLSQTEEVQLRSGTFSNESTERKGLEKRGIEAFSKVVDEYQHRVYGFVKKMVPTGEDAEDITQEVFIRAFQNYERFDDRASVRTWLFRIAYNLCVDRSRKQNRRLKEVSLNISSEIEEQFDVPDERWQPDRILEDTEFRSRIELAIEQMSEKLRSVLLLHDREDLSYEEIAETLKIPVGTVKSRLFLARGQLQSAVKELIGDQS
jgi:RNA polymerase sigma-70 factor, ECF subfamily